MTTVTTTVVLTLLGAALHCLWRLRSRWRLVTVEGTSMTPTLRAGDRLLVRRADPRRVAVGDIVVIRRPDPHRSAGIGGSPSGRSAGPERWMIKRIVARPGDTVPDMPQPSVLTRGAPVPPGMFVLLGDNQADSVDSRLFGYVAGGEIMGVVRRQLGGADPCPRREVVLRQHELP